MVQTPKLTIDFDKKFTGYKFKWKKGMLKLQNLVIVKSYTNFDGDICNN